MVSNSYFWLRTNRTFIHSLHWKTSNACGATTTRPKGLSILHPSNTYPLDISFKLARTLKTVSQTKNVDVDVVFTSILKYRIYF